MVAEEWIEVFEVQIVSDRIILLIPASEFLTPCGEWNGQVGRTGTGFRKYKDALGMAVRILTPRERESWSMH